MRGKIVCGGVALLVLVVALAACQGAPAATAVPPTPKLVDTAVPPTAVPPTAVPPTVVPTDVPPPVVVRPALYDEATAKGLWEAGPHNNAYDLYKGPNTYCAMCHSPKNFDPAAKVGKPPNCFSCKFPTDTEVRISPLAPLIPEEEWAKVDCYVCHDGDNYSEIAIWNQATGEYQPVATSTQLCQKCHLYSSGGSKHQIVVGGPAHSNQITFAGNRPELCADCHDPHSLEATCSNSKCHTDIMNPEKGIQGHDADHAKVDCFACHDSSGAPVGIDPVTKRFTTGSTTGGGMAGAVSGAGDAAFAPAASHQLIKKNDCTRCHSEGNPWGLSVIAKPATGRPSS